MELMENTDRFEHQRRYEKAKKRARAIRSFYVNLSAYCIVIPMLVYINLAYTPEIYWFIFSMLGWGIGLMFHAMEAFDWNPFLGKDWEQRKINEILENENANNKTMHKMEHFNDAELAKYERAKKRVRAISGFYRHLAVYILVNLFLIVLKYVNLDHDEDFWKFSTFSTAFYWGIGLLFHAFGVFYNNVYFGREWEERKIQQLMEKEKKQNWE